MPDRVARRVDHLGRRAAQPDHIPLGDRLIERWKPVGISPGPDDFRAIPGADRRNRCDVVVVVMGQDDGIQPAARRLDGIHDRRLFRRVDDCNESRRVVAEQPGVVIG